MSEIYFSIVTPVYNGEKYLEDTIKSVVNQSFKNFEYIVIDGESKDNSINIINKYKDKITKIIANHIAIVEDIPEIPPKPNTAATIAITKNTTAQTNQPDKAFLSI